MKYRYCPFKRRDNSKKKQNTLTESKKYLLQNHWANLIHIWHRAVWL